LIETVVELIDTKFNLVYDPEYILLSMYAVYEVSILLKICINSIIFTQTASRII